MMVNGTAKNVGFLSSVVRAFLLTGYLYHYAFAMIGGMLVMLVIFFFST